MIKHFEIHKKPKIVQELILAGKYFILRSNLLKFAVISS